MNTEPIQASYGRCLRNKEFIAGFYQRLQGCDPTVETMFAHTNWPQQQKALRRGISAALTFAGGSNIVQGMMDQMAEVHSRNGRAPVPPDYYRYWRDSLMASVREHDPKLTPKLEETWRQALDLTCQYFIDRY